MASTFSRSRNLNQENYGPHNRGVAGSALCGRFTHTYCVLREMIAASQVTEGVRERLVRAFLGGGVSVELSLPRVFPLSPLENQTDHAFDARTFVALQSPL